ncbi:MAG TPA: class I SAM-dependent methyltransferase [Candidatus Tyrphobacter sp.]
MQALQDDRKTRERDIHDQRFAAGGTRGAVDKAYAIVGASHGDFKRRLITSAPGKRILEIGCAQGSNVLEFASAGATATGIDISDVAVRHARARAEELGLNASFFAMDAEATGFSDGSFDVVSGSAILHHLDTESAYREVARLLDFRGLALFVEPLGHNPFINLYRRLTPSLRTPDEHPLLLRDLELARKYFDTVNITYYYLTTLLTLPVAATRIGSTLIRIANAVDRVLFRFVPPLRKQAWYIVLELRGPRW